MTLHFFCLPWRTSIGSTQEGFSSSGRVVERLCHQPHPVLFCIFLFEMNIHPDGYVILPLERLEFNRVTHWQKPGERNKEPNVANLHSVGNRSACTQFQSFTLDDIGAVLHCVSLTAILQKDLYNPQLLTDSSLNCSVWTRKGIFFNEDKQKTGVRSKYLVGAAYFPEVFCPMWRPESLIFLNLALLWKREQTKEASDALCCFCGVHWHIFCSQPQIDVSWTYFGPAVDRELCSCSAGCVIFWESWQMSCFTFRLTVFLLCPVAHSQHVCLGGAALIYCLNRVDPATTLRRVITRCV